MEDNPTYVVDFPPLPANPSRIAPSPSSTIAAPLAPISTGFGHPTAYDAFLADEADEELEVAMEAEGIPTATLPDM